MLKSQLMEHHNIFISDLHLSDNDPGTTEKFLYLMQNIVPKFKNLYILGDLFEYWLGDDCIQQYQKFIIQILANASQNTKIYFIPGNRDFLIGKKFAELAKLTILPDPSIIFINNQKIILSHGDKYCWNDKKYLIYRKLAQNFFIKKLFLALPKCLRHKIANKLSSKPKSMSLLTINQKYNIPNRAILYLLKKYDSLRLIHGHTHKPQSNLNYITLGDWQSNPNYLDQNLELIFF